MREIGWTSRVCNARVRLILQQHGLVVFVGAGGTKGRLVILQACAAGYARLMIRKTCRMLEEEDRRMI